MQAEEEDVGQTSVPDASEGRLRAAESPQPPPHQGPIQPWLALWIRRFHIKGGTLTIGKRPNEKKEPVRIVDALS